MEPINRTALLSILKKQFNENELRDLCFDLGIDYDDLGGKGKAGNARELVAYAERHGRLDDLVARCRERAPNQHPFAALPLDRVPEVATLPPGSLMPLASNPLFVGREPDLLALARALKEGGTAAIGPMAAATGLGGIGKTQLAVEFAHRYGQFFAGGVFWLSFAEPAGVGAAVAQCGGAGAMNLAAFDTFTFDDQVARVRQEWQSPTPRLLVFDNCEDEALLDTWRPKSGGCRVLITSRRQQWDASLGVQARALDTLPRAESIALLRKFRPDLPEDDADLDAIAAELGDLPLALHLAGSFLRQYRADTTPAEYLAELRSAALLDHDSLQGLDLTISPTNHDLHVGRTFALSYDRLDSAKVIDSLALDLLARAAYFAPGEPILRELLLATVELPDAPARRRASRAVSRLIALGLFDAEINDALRLHRLLAVFVRGQAPDAEAQAAIEQAMLQTANRLINTGYPPLLVALQAHLRHITDRALLRADEPAARLGNTFGYHLKMSGDLAGARPYYEQALAIRQAVLGERHPDTAGSLNNLGVLLRAQGDLAGARPYYEQALAICQAVLGERHPDTARSLNNLGFLLYAQGDLTGARPYLEQALAICQAVLGERHRNTAQSLNNLAALLYAEGELAQARPYFEQALAIRQVVLGERHPDTAQSLNDLGALLRAEGELAQAQLYVEQALAICQAVLGERHPVTATSLNNLGRLLQTQGDLAGARPYYEQALAIRQVVLGERHPDTASSLNNLGFLLQDMGDLAGARPYYEQALAICQAVLGERHPDTARSLGHLGFLLRAQGDLAGARPYYEQALAICQAVLGERHPDTASSLNNLGFLLYAQGDLTGARPYLEQALAIRERALGADHPNTRAVRRKLDALIAAQADEVKPPHD